MRILWSVPLLWAMCVHADDGDAVRRAVAAFNDPRQRATVAAPGADLDDLSRFRGAELSQVFFETKAVRFVTADVAVVDAAGSQYGSLIMKRSLPALLVLKKEGGAWRVAVLRVSGPPCEPTAFADAHSPASSPPNRREGDRRQ